MSRQSIVNLLFLIGILIGCTTISEQNQPAPMRTGTPASLALPTENRIVTATSTQLTSTVESVQSPTPSSTPLPIPMVTNTPAVDPLSNNPVSAESHITDLCGTVYSDTTAIDISYLTGIVTRDLRGSHDDVVILGEKGEVAYRWSVPVGRFTATTSPDGQWLAATFYDSFDVDGNATEVMVQVVNPNTDESYQLQLAAETIQFYSDALLEFDWLSNESLYISKLTGASPTIKEGGMLEMHYFVWSPFVDEIDEFTVALPDYVYMHFEPTLDPLLEYVSYSCLSSLTCEQDTLRIWDISSGTSAWSVEKGFALGFPDAGVWSWDGQMVAVFDVQHEQETIVKIFSRNGQLLHETRVPGEVNGRSTTWAPNNEFLTFDYWDSIAGKGRFLIFDLIKGTTTRYCRGGAEVWSPDSKLTVATTFKDEGTHYAYYAYVFEISSGDLYLWQEGEFPIQIYGWANPVIQ